MSRGGGRFGGGKNILKGATWEQDPNFKPEARDIKPSDLFPPVPDLPTARALTLADKRILQNSKALRNAIHQGPLYTESQRKDPFETKRTYGEEQRNALYMANSAQANKAKFDPFETGVPTYSQKYSRVKRTIPQLSGRPFNKELFPPELHDTLEGHSSRPGQRKKLVLSMTPAQLAIEEARRKQLLDNLGGEDEDADEKEDEDGVPEEEEEQDDAFEEDDDDIGGDYDAENYFDNGDGEEDMDDDGGGGSYE